MTRVPSRPARKGSVPTRSFISAARRADFCDRVAGLSDTQPASAGSTRMKKVLRAFVTVAVFLFLPVAAFAQTEAVDLTAAFVDGGVTIDRLLVYQIGGIVLIRGRTGDASLAAEAGRFATSRGYRRVANLIEINPDIGDSGIERVAHDRLERARELTDCRFQLDSVGGVVSLRGHVARDVQRDFAIHLIGRIDGVKSVLSTLTLVAPRVREGVRE